MIGRFLMRVLRTGMVLIGVSGCVYGAVLFGPAHGPIVKAAIYFAAGIAFAYYGIRGYRD